MKYYKDAIKEILSSCIVMAVIIFVVFAATGEMEAAIYGGIVYWICILCLFWGFAFLKSRWFFFFFFPPPPPPPPPPPYI